jgi:hypothetical protein
MTFALRSWPRHGYESGGGEPFLVYYVYGSFPELPTMRVDRYNSSGVPRGLDLQMYNRNQHPEVLDGFLSGHFGQFLEQKPEIAKKVRAAKQCIVLKGQPSEASSLDYLRDCIGVLMYLLDCGGEAVLDPQTLTWWRPTEWKEVFSSETIQPGRHVTILGSPEEAHPEQLWLHTRGMRKFGRPDLSVHNVFEQQRPLILETIERFVNYQAFGGIICEGEELELEGISGTWRCIHQGTEDDPDFNNRHVEIKLAGEAIEQG